MYSASLAVVGVSFFPGESAFFRGLNSSSRTHSQTKKVSENYKLKIKKRKKFSNTYLVNFFFVEFDYL